MNCVLSRERADPDGIFGVLRDERGQFLAETLEHAFLLPNGSYAPKLAPGTYICRRGTYLLEGMKAPFTTFEITNVPDFLGKPVTKILFHVGNWNVDSNGCVMLGMTAGPTMIFGSEKAFEAFMALQEGCEEFILVVR